MMIAPKPQPIFKVMNRIIQVDGTLKLHFRKDFGHTEDNDVCPASYVGNPCTKKEEDYGDQDYDAHCILVIKVIATKLID